MQQEKLSLANFSERLRYALEKKGAKPTPVAKKLGISSGYLSELLKGIKDKPSLETLRKLSGELECSIEWLEKGSGDYFQTRNAQSSTNPKDFPDERMKKTLSAARQFNELLRPDLGALVAATLEKLDASLSTAALNDGRMQAKMIQHCHEHLEEFAKELSTLRTHKPDTES